MHDCTTTDLALLRGMASKDFILRFRWILRPNNALLASAITYHWVETSRSLLLFQVFLWHEKRSQGEAKCGKTEQSCEDDAAFIQN